jgi:hypothetical protein
MVPLTNVLDTIRRIADWELIVLASDASDVVIDCPNASAKECLAFINRRGTNSRSR